MKKNSKCQMPVDSCLYVLLHDPVEGCVWGWGGGGGGGGGLRNIVK